MLARFFRLPDFVVKICIRRIYWRWLFELLSRPVEDGGPSGHATPSDDRSLSSDDVSLSSQSDESLSAKVERLTKKLEERREQKRRGEEESTFFSNEYYGRSSHDLLRPV
ncbi:UBX domain-containing protein 4-like [Brienomyrus brachyistius]|uniref:UBX domain-containing protein 4-like n=1 Tax=Brienomyrus brachyistius TaxID=42636 RepID=UPI0020B2B812|nr:UBX domain-containing protein 4-like [Brienomyrus brachyistius]